MSFFVSLTTNPRVAIESPESFKLSQLKHKGEKQLEITRSRLGGSRNKLKQAKANWDSSTEQPCTEGNNKKENRKDIGQINEHWAELTETPKRIAQLRASLRSNWSKSSRCNHRHDAVINRHFVWIRRNRPICYILKKGQDLRKVPHFLFASLAVNGIFSSLMALPSHLKTATLSNLLNKPHYTEYVHVMFGFQVLLFVVLSMLWPYHQWRLIDKIVFYGRLTDAWNQVISELS